MSTPVRLQRSRKRGSNIKEQSLATNGLDYVYVGRGSRWGNPFRVVQYSDGKWSVKTDGSERCNEILVKHGHAVYNTKKEAVEDAIKCYDFWLLPYTHNDGNMEEFFQSISVIEDAMQTLKGKNLVCWCEIVDKNDDYCMCHADLLLSLANNKSIHEIRKENIKTIVR